MKYFDGNLKPRNKVFILCASCKTLDNNSVFHFCQKSYFSPQNDGMKNNIYMP